MTTRHGAYPALPRSLPQAGRDGRQADGPGTPGRHRPEAVGQRNATRPGSLRASWHSSMGLDRAPGSRPGARSSGDQYGKVWPNHVPQLRNAARSVGPPFLPTYSAANQTLPASSVAAAL